MLQYEDTQRFSPVSKMRVAGDAGLWLDWRKTGGGERIRGFVENLSRTDFSTALVARGVAAVLSPLPMRQQLVLPSGDDLFSVEGSAAINDKTEPSDWEAILGRRPAAVDCRGLIAEYGLAWLLPKVIGHANALDILLSARVLDAQEALRMGLVNQVFAPDVFLDRVYAYANDLAHGVSPRSMRVMKRQVYDAMFQTLGEAVDEATEEMRASLQCEDFKEGVAHFLEKRAPAFTGR